MKHANRNDIVHELGQKWNEGGKRHLYLVLGRCSELEALARDLANARMPDRQQVGEPIRVNAALLDRLKQQNKLDELDGGEAKYPTMVRERLKAEFEVLVKGALDRKRAVVLGELELLFAFELDLALLRREATNGRHIVLLLPGERIGDRVVLFHEADERFQRALPTNLVMDTHIWEVANGN